MIERSTELSRKLALLGQVADEHMLRIVEQEAKRIQAEAKLLCPVWHGELRNSIRTMAERMDDTVTGTVYTNKAYASYVEFGTGPTGAANHEGISPAVNPSYTMTPWWIHESQIDAETAETCRWPHIDTPNGRFYKCTGQAAQPFMYPALKNNEDKAVKNMERELKNELRRVCET